MDGYGLLATAIVERAVIDYKAALNERDTRNIKSLQRFFLSDWFCELAECDDQKLMQKIEEVVS